MTYAVGTTVHLHNWDESASDHVITDSDHAVIFDREPRQGDCFESTPCVYDITDYWEATENYVLSEGYIGVAVHEEDQAAIDKWKELYDDCWGTGE